MTGEESANDGLTAGAAVAYLEGLLNRLAGSRPGMARLLDRDGTLTSARRLSAALREVPPNALVSVEQRERIHELEHWERTVVGR